jgi:hypothetical protein
MMNSVDVRIIFGIIALVPCAYSAWQAIHEGNHEKQKTWIINVLLWVAIAAWCNFFEMGLAIISMTISMGIYLKQDKQTQEFNGFQEKALKDLRKGSQAAFDVLVAMRNDDLRKLYQNSELASHFTNLDAEQRELEKKRANYWEYKWIFETHEHVTLTVKDLFGDPFPITIKILKTTKDFHSEKLIKTKESFDLSYYLCQVDPDFYHQENAGKYLSEQDINFYWDTANPNFWKGRLIACTFSNDKVLVYSSQNEGKISLKGLYYTDCREIRDIHGGKSTGGKVDFLSIHSEDTNYFKRLVDHKVSTS